ncbi:MAG: LytTR family DNA-binding domain-containing protein [Clostridiales bacterium]|nr:LytTR family DNA-binding domain-containing protein [Roseburia sp.]MDD7636607.1 LytTR family DNA-binding domain-containing protein [Clostridiales bacterium]MDY4113717.1 LytTR family DNA-binding domain-containing protein [Roseburia sp.]
MIQIAICDDEKECRKTIAEYCDRYCKQRNLKACCREYASGEVLLEHGEADILLLDVEMAGMDGLQVKDLLGRQRADTRILFISSHEEALPEAFGRQVYGFLKKPVDYGQLEKKLDIVVADLEEQNRCILYESTGSIRKISMNQILYIQADGKYTKVFLMDEEGYVFSDKSISEWKEELGPNDFGMCHRSYFVNFYYVKQIQEDIMLANNQHIPVSRRMEKEFRENYRRYIWRKAK